MRAVEALLRDLGLPQYVEAFHEAAVDWDVAHTLTEADLEALGVQHWLHRRKLLMHFAAARADPGETARTGDAEARPGLRERGSRPTRVHGGGAGELKGVEEERAKAQPPPPPPPRWLAFEALRLALIFVVFVALHTLATYVFDMDGSRALQRQRAEQLRALCPEGVDCVAALEEQLSRQ